MLTYAVCLNDRTAVIFKTCHISAVVMNVRMVLLILWSSTVNKKLILMYLM